jgi:Mg/Co/Ni transporter MgtE
VSAPVEHKVTAAGGGALTGSITAEFVVYLLSQYVYGGKDVPSPVSLFVLAMCTTAFAVAGGWLAPHTARPREADAAPVVEDPVPAPADEPSQDFT